MESREASPPWTADEAGVAAALALAGSLFYDDPPDEPAPWHTPRPPASASAPRAAPGSGGGGSGGAQALIRLLQQRHQREQQHMYEGPYAQPDSPVAPAGAGGAQQADDNGPTSADARQLEQAAAAEQPGGGTDRQQPGDGVDVQQDEQPPLLDPDRPLCPNCWRLPSGALRNHSSGIKVCPACNLHSRSNGGQLRQFTAEQRRQHAQQAQQALQQREQQQAAVAAAEAQQEPMQQLPERRPKRKAAAAVGPSSTGSSGGRDAAAEAPRSTVRQQPSKPVHHPRPNTQQAKRSRPPRNVYQALSDSGVDAALVHALFWRCAAGGLGDKEAEWLLLMLERGDVAAIEHLLRGPAAAGPAAGLAGVLAQPPAPLAEVGSMRQ